MNLFFSVPYQADLETEVILDREKTVKLAALLPYAGWFHKIG